MPRTLSGNMTHPILGGIARSVEGVLQLEEVVGLNGVAYLGPQIVTLAIPFDELVSNVSVAGVHCLPSSSRSY